jgi:protein NRD1
MHTRKDAVAAHAGMQTLQNDPEVQSKFRQTRWGVGFGPREYHNYDNGVSVIPIKLLTEADRKWVVTAEYGGTGGEPIQEHLVIEEPDIEIGAGVSSKGKVALLAAGDLTNMLAALSRRIVPGSNNNHNANMNNHNSNNNNSNNHNHSEPSGPSGPSGGRNRGNNNNNNNPGGGGGGRGGGQSRSARRRAERHEKRFSPAVRPDAPVLPEPATIVAPPPVPGFGFQLPGMR